MKNFKKVLCAVLMLCMVVPMFVFGSAAEEVAKFEDNWTTLGAKFSSGTYNILLDTGTNKPRDEGFTFTRNENGGIDVHVPDYSVFGGGCPTAILASKNATALDGLTVKLSLADETVFKRDGKGFYSTYSLLWSKDPITAVYDPETGIGEDSSEAAVTNAMRRIGGPDKQGIYVVIGGGDPNKKDTKIASFVNLYLFNGEFYDAIDGEAAYGYRWTFAARNMPEVGGSGNNGDNSGIRRGHESIDLTDGLIISFRADTTLGYVTVVNGVEYYKGKSGVGGSLPYLGYYPANIKFDRGTDRDGANGFTDLYKQSMEYQGKDVDLSFLGTIDKGYVSVMSVGNLISTKKQDKCYQDFTLDTVNGVPAADWDAHVHTWGDWEIVTEPTCVDGLKRHVCSGCGAEEEEPIPATMEHSFTDWTVTIEPTCKPGLKVCSCTRCLNDFEEVLDPIREHSWGEWTVTTEPSLKASGVETHVCAECGDEETRNIGKIVNPFTDVPSNKWFALPAVYCNTKGFMNGVSSGKFAPNDNLTRAMFVQILAKIANADLSKYTKDNEGLPFTDTKGAWYSKALKWAYENGYTSGKTATTFGPGDNVTRQELAKFLFTYSEKNSLPSADADDLSGYLDTAKVAKWAKTAMGWAVGNGLISGVKVEGGMNLDPKGNATRGQVATIIKNFVQSVVGDTAVEYELTLD